MIEKTLENARKNIILAYTFAGFPTILIFGFLHIILGNFIIGIIEISISAFCLIIIPYFIMKKKNIQFASKIALFFALIFFSILFINGGFQKTGIFWLLTFPVAAVFLSGNKQGFIWSMFFLCTIIMLLITFRLLSLNLAYNNVFYIVFFIAYIILSVCMYFFDKYRENAENQAELANAVIKEKNRELENMLEDKNKLLGIVSHDLRTPLAIIQSITYVLKNESKHLINNDFIKLYDDILSSINRMLSLIDELLDYSAIMHSSIKISKEKVNLDGFMNSIYKLYKMITDKKGLNFTLTIEDNLPEIEMDKNKISQVIDNLISNSIKFSNNGGEIRLSAIRENNFIKVIISDQGPGIKKEYLDSLFQYFQKTDNKPREGEKSTGLGLAICKRIVELHSGQIEIESNTGSGATFFFTLPV